MVRQAPRLTVREILLQLSAKGVRRADNSILIVSGGNPALHHLDPLLDELDGVCVHVETQGTKFRPWLNRCELVVVSPKPPSAWPATSGPRAQARRGVEVAQKFLFNMRTRWALKMVVFDETDLSWATWAHWHLAGGVGFEGTYLSAGTDQAAHGDDMSWAVVKRYRWLANAVLARPQLAGVRIGLQAHQLVWPGELAR